MKGYKGFDKNFKCKGRQYSVGETVEHAGEFKLCSSGLHFCEYPLDVFLYYPPANSKFAEVEADCVSSEREKDSKRVCKKLHIAAEISIKTMIEAAIKFTFDRADSIGKGRRSTSDRGAASATGDQGAASATGYRGAALATGHQGAASATGEEGCAVALGNGGRASGKKGCWITLAEWKEKKDGAWQRVDVQTLQVDGKKVKEDVFYRLKKGTFVEAEVSGKEALT